MSGPLFGLGLAGATAVGCASWIKKECSRCGSTFYVHSYQNCGMNWYPGKPELCDWCEGRCSAANQDHATAAIEAHIRRQP